MHVIFVVVLGFIGYALLFFLKKRKTILSVNILYISSLLTLFSLFVYGISHYEIGRDLPLGILFSCLNGPLLLLLTVEKQRSLGYFLALALALLVFLGGFFYCYFFFPEHIKQFNAIIQLVSILTAVGFGSYGYLNFINNKEHTKYQEVAILYYVVLLFVFAFLFSSAWLKGGERFMNNNSLFLCYGLCILLYAYFHEGIIFIRQYQQKKTTSAKILKWKYFQGTNVMITRKVVQGKEAAEKKEKGKEVIRSEASFLDPTLLKQLLYTKIIETGLFLDHNLTLHKVAELTLVDKNKLNDYFKKSQSSSFKQYINRLKVEYAINVIREREKNITVEELTVVCGFNTRLSFYRAFVYFYGFAPSELLTD